MGKQQDREQKPRRPSWHQILYAYHEAGHAVVGHILGRCISEISIAPNRGRGYQGYCAFDEVAEAWHDVMQWQAESLTHEQIAVLYAGTLAMQLLCQQQGWNYEHWRGCDRADFAQISCDFNGIPIRTIIARCQVQGGRVKGILRTLLQEGKITLEFGDHHPNPHIKALPEDRPDKQEEKLAKVVFRNGNICVYPSPAHLRTVVSATDYQGRPFTLRLALGEPQLTHVSFDLQVLEFYRNDPRYYYRNDDVQGHIGIKDEFYESAQMPASDQILLERFGFSCNLKLNRAVAVFLRYLSRLSPEHQQLWNTRIVQGDYQLHPAYFEATILGRWYEKTPIFHAFLEEQEIINKMGELMGRPPLFREVFKEDKKPRGFGFLIRPMLREFNDFVHLLDKMLSDNLNKKFFGDDIPLEQEEVRKDGKIIVREKGTIRLLEEWLAAQYNPADRQPIDEMFATMKKIRKMRQYPAHAVDENVFDQTYIEQQRQLIIAAYEAVNTLRQVFSYRPQARNYQVPSWLDEGKIYTY